MKSIDDKTTLVLAGNFNPAILRPKWVAVHGLGHPESQEFQVEMVASLGESGFRRYTFDGISYTAAFNAVTLHLKISDSEQCSKSVTAAANILSRLPHTPVSGMGFNFGFLVTEPSPELIGLMRTSTAAAETFPGNPEVVTRKWGNVIKWDRCLVGIECELAGGQAIIDFNFHYATSSAQDAGQILGMENIFESHKERAIAAAKALTGQDLEE